MNKKWTNIKGFRVDTSSCEGDIDIIFTGKISIVDAIVNSGGVFISSSWDDVEVLQDSKVILVAIRESDF
jgi:hypothetical protein